MLRELQSHCGEMERVRNMLIVGGRRGAIMQVHSLYYVVLILVVGVNVGGLTIFEESEPFAGPP